MPAELNINTSLVRQLIAAQFPEWGNLVVRPVEVDGHDNRTFHLGDEMLVRMPSAECYAQKVLKEQHWLLKLGPLLPMPIPVPLKMGVSADIYPWHWSVYKWLEGENASVESIADLNQFATDLAEFLLALQKIDSSDGPPAGPHNFFRGGSLKVYDDETRQAIAALRGEIDVNAATELWEEALEATWHGAPVWIHGDVSAGNLLVKNGSLSAVIDFGGLGVGDPACDLTIAWTFLSKKSRETFRAAINLDAATWSRARGWALWKALITLVEFIHSNPKKAANAKYVIDEVIAEHRT